MNDYDGVVCSGQWKPGCRVGWMAVQLIVVVVMLDRITDNFMVYCLISVGRSIISPEI